MKKIAMTLFLLSMFGIFYNCNPGAVITDPNIITSNQTGTDGGYFYSFWTNGGGSVRMTLDDGSGYNLTWSNVGNFVVGKGWNPCSDSAVFTWTGSATNAQYFGVYGWLSSPLVEYYIGRGGGTSAGTYSTSRGSYTLNTISCNGPNITGNGNFVQFNCSGAGDSPINLGEHFTGWVADCGKTVTTQNYCIMATEGWGSSTGSSSVTLE